MAWDVKGDGKTSVKVSFGKYLEAASSGNGNYTAGNPVARMPTNMALGVAGPTAITRSWSDTNQNFTPDCVLENPLANGECGNLSNTSFGKPVFTNSFNSDLMGGWGMRPSDWGFVASIQQQVLPRTSVEFSYTRRWLNGFTVTDNLATVAGDYRPFSVTAPTDARLGAASGQQITRPLQRHAGSRGAGAEQLQRAGRRHRQPVSALQRVPREHQLARARRADAAGRDQLRQDGQRQLRDSRAPFRS